VYDFLWGESGSRVARDEEGVEENEARGRRERRRRGRKERRRKERINKYKNMETSEIKKRLEAFQKINRSQHTEEEIKELTSRGKIYASRVLTAISGIRYK